MQPKEAQVDQIKFAPHPGKQKENLSKDQRPLTPAEQWDQLAFTLMYQELAPKGFKKFTNGHWRGAEHADIPFLSKKTVQKCQKISAQLVRGYRDKVKKDLNSELDEVNKALDASKWYQVFKRIGLNHKGAALTSFLLKLNNTPVK